MYVYIFVYIKKGAQKLYYYIKTITLKFLLRESDFDMICIEFRNTFSYLYGTEFKKKGKEIIQ